MMMKGVSSVKSEHLRVVVLVAAAVAGLSGCSNAGPNMDGAWVSESMRDPFECQSGRVMVINGGTIQFGIAGRVVRSFEGLETEVGDDGMIVMRSAEATFQFAPGESPDEVTLLSGPIVVEHHTSRTPAALARC